LHATAIFDNAFAEETAAKKSMQAWRYKPGQRQREQKGERPASKIEGNGRRASAPMFFRHSIPLSRMKTAASATRFVMKQERQSSVHAQSRCMAHTRRRDPPPSPPVPYGRATSA